jgi:hypothetical protein
VISAAAGLDPCLTYTSNFSSQLASLLLRKEQISVILDIRRDISILFIGI